MYKIDYSKIPDFKNKYLQCLELQPEENDDEKTKKRKQRNYVKLSTAWKKLKEQICILPQNNNQVTRQKALYDMEIEDFLTADFEILAKIYLDFINLLPRDEYENIIHGNGTNGKKISDTNPRIENPLMEESKEVFNYTETRARQIASFFYKSNSKLNISTCFYCNASYINFFETKNITGYKRMFDIDHFIPKAQCPILSLCLYNFVPCCKVCNGKTIKGDTPFQEFYRIQNLLPNEKLDQIQRLAPTSKNYKFEENVKITIIPNSQKNGVWKPDITFLDNPDNYRIDFIHFENDYFRETKAFDINERYNSPNTIHEALNILDLRKKYDKNNIKYIKDILCKYGNNITEDEIEEDIFHTKFNNNHGIIYSKMKKDILQ